MIGFRHISHVASSSRVFFIFLNRYTGKVKIHEPWKVNSIGLKEKDGTMKWKKEKKKKNPSWTRLSLYIPNFCIVLKMDLTWVVAVTWGTQLQSALTPKNTTIWNI